MIETPPLVDQYCQGVLRTELGLATFEAQLIPSAGPPAAGTTFFDTQTGFALRRWCPPLLGLEPHCTPARYLARRRELGAAESARRLLRGSGVGARLVDTGVPGDLTGPKELALAGEAETFELVRLELLAEQAADTSGTAGAFLVNLAEAVHHAAAVAVAFTCGPGAGYPAALAGSPEPPGPGEVRGAAGRWLAGRARGGAVRDPVLLRHLLWSAVASGLPLQLHVGGGAGEPEPLTEFVRATAGLGTRLVLLGGYPYHRQAARLAAAFPHVHAELGTALGQSGARAAAVLAESLESAPFGKLMYAGGGGQLAELHAVGALVFREALGRVLGGWVAEGSWSWRDAERVAAMVAAGNARRVYRLDERN
ncbi:amidohydrolase family protein [Streptomyces sp. NBC_00503]|uniref:amidohydrolase family protein n=1 Tax=Streptomyces sp. NBC_00503 TaxID=2903659 RepID=UPI002E801D33|nr:amidohydrolase family protein [Streptomyces sp. NBC_00503]WUD80702.1 amidohydrolase [Streptomyces sp. NBC_00503]